jgi:hypothetical protein
VGLQRPVAERGRFAGKRFAERPERRFYFKLALALGKTVKQLLAETDSQEIAEWYAYDQRWPLPDPWGQTARLCRIVMAASGNYKRGSLPEESAFIPTAVRPEQSREAMMNEIMKLMKPQG